MGWYDNEDFSGEAVANITCTDKAGNTSTGVTVGAGLDGTGIILEDHAPRIAFQEENGVLAQPGEYEEAPDIAVTVTDNKDNAVSGGIASVSYQVGGGAVKAVDHDYTTSMVVNDSFTIPSSEIPTGETVISVTAADHAGNSITERHDIKVQDSGDPPGEAGTVSKDVEKDEKASDTMLSTSKEELAEIILTEDEKAQVEKGTDIKFILDVPEALKSRDSALYTNIKKVQVKKITYTLKKGASVTLQPRVVLQDPRKLQLTAAHTREFHYLSSNRKVATVTKGGKVKAKGAGSCTIYVFAKDGCKRKIKITVKK